MLKFIIKQIAHISFNGKYLILSRLYQELLKTEINNLRKKKEVMRKAVRYPAAFFLELA
jgi:hypothetical protein